jgi:ABC-type Fe3+ transport system permease subunit
MWVVVAFLAIVIVVTPVVIVVWRGETERHDDPPWVLFHLAGQHVFIMAGLAGFAVTGIVLTVGLLQGKST